MSGTGFLRGSNLEVSLEPGEFEIGKIVVKDDTAATTSVVAVPSGIVGTSGVLGVHDPASAGRLLGTGGDVLDINAAGDRSVLLGAGIWRLAPTVECWFRQGGVAVVATKAGAGSSYLAGGGIEILKVIDANDGYVHVIAGDDPVAGKASITKEE